MVCRKTKSKQEISCFNLSATKLVALISSENEFEDFGLAAKTALYMKRSIKKNSSKNWQRANSRGSLTTGCFWALTQAFPPSGTGRGQHIWYRQDLGSAVVLGQIKNPNFLHCQTSPFTHPFCAKRDTLHSQDHSWQGKGWQTCPRACFGRFAQEGSGRPFQTPFLLKETSNFPSARWSSGRLLYRQAPGQKQEGAWTGKRLDK